MSREKQIEEMAKVLRPLALCPNCLSSLNRDKKRDGDCYRPIGYECSLDRDILKYCEALYNAGYRKQSEGENIAMYPSSAFECSECHWQDWDLFTADSSYNFCPNCGAKMKGGAEE